MFKVLSAEISALLTAAFALGLLGLLTGSWFIASLVVFGAYLAWFYLRLAKLEEWVRRGTKASKVYDDSGFLGNIIRPLYQQKKSYNERKKRTKAILRRLNRNISALPDATVLLNAEHEIEWCNEPAKYLLNIRSPQDLGHRISNLLRAPEFLKYLAKPESREYIEIDSASDM